MLQHSVMQYVFLLGKDSKHCQSHYCAQLELMPRPHHSLTMMGYLFIIIRVCFVPSRDSTIKSYLVFLERGEFDYFTKNAF